MYSDPSLTQAPAGMPPLRYLPSSPTPLTSFHETLCLFSLRKWTQGRGTGVGGDQSSHFPASITIHSPSFHLTAVEAYRQILELLDANSTNKKQKGRMNALLAQWGPQVHQGR